MAAEIQTLGARTYYYGTLAELEAETPAAGDLGFATDGRKAAESASNGTGNLVVHDGSNWIRVDTGATADD